MPDEIHAHTYASGEQAFEASLRSVALAAEATGQPQAIHRHTASEPCRGGPGGCRVVSPDGNVADLYAAPRASFPAFDGAVVNGSGFPVRQDAAPAGPRPVQDMDQLMGYGDGHPEGLV